MATLATLTGCGGPPPTSAFAWLAIWGQPGRTDGKFYHPRALAATANRVYVVDKTYRVQAFSTNGEWLATWPLEEINRGYPSGMGVTPSGALIVADSHNHRVLVYDHAGNVVLTFGAEGGGPGEFTYLTDVACDSQGCLYVSEHGRNDRIQKFDAQGRFLMEWGSTGSEQAMFRRPQGLAIDAEDHIYVADAANHRVQKFDARGNWLATIGQAGRGPGEMLYPYDLAIGPGGALLVCEYGNNRIQMFDRLGLPVAVIGKPGHEPGAFSSPWAVEWVEGVGLIVADTLNHRLQVFRM